MAVTQPFLDEKPSFRHVPWQQNVRFAGAFKRGFNSARHQHRGQQQQFCVVMREDWTRNTKTTRITEVRSEFVICAESPVRGRTKSKSTMR